MPPESMPTESVPTCPECGGPLKAGAMALCHRDEDDRRVCRMVWGCSGRHVWWKWADRPADPLELCPYPDLVGG
ncbi:dehydrogenase [Streptomyces fungicidicus]